MQYRKFLEDCCREGWVRIDDEDNIELTIDGNRFDQFDDIVIMIETLCSNNGYTCMMDRDYTDDGVSFFVGSEKFAKEFMLAVVIA